MVVKSADGSIEVSVSERPNASGKFTVSARQLVKGSIRAYITVDFGGQDNSTRIDYNSQAQPPGTKAWPASGSHPGDTVQQVTIAILSKT